MTASTLADTANGLTGTLLARLFDYPSRVTQPGDNASTNTALEHALGFIDVVEQVAFIATLDYPEHAHEFVDEVARLGLRECLENRWFQGEGR